MASDIVELDELTSNFLAESREMLDEVEPYLIELGKHSSEAGAVDEETVNLVFRLFHSLKGSAGFFQFSRIVNVTHIAETLLDLFRSGQGQMGAEHTDVLCRACDMVGLLLEQIESTGNDQGHEALVDQISAELSATIDRVKRGEPEAGSARISLDAGKGKRDSEAEAQLDADDQDTPVINLEADAQALFPMGEMTERFVQEADEQLDRVEQVLLECAKSSNDQEALNDAFRALHSFKGNSGMLGFNDLERLSHCAETAWEAIKLGRVQLSSVNNTLLHVNDVLREGVAAVSQGQTGNIPQLSVLLDMLTDMIPGDVEEKSEEEKPPKRAHVIQPEAMQLLREEEVSTCASKEDMDQDIASATATSGATFKPRSVVRNDIRVDLRKLDQLINLVGELVIGEAMVTRNPDLYGMELENFERAATHLNKIVRDLQDVAMSVRMIPIAGIFRKMIRLVHDLSGKAHKKIELQLLGEETEIDKTVAEQLADPLVHLVRNSIDHGIEPPDERVACGKPETGRIVIEAKHEGGEVWIVISDDGRGLSREKILAKGIEKDLIKGDGSDMTDAEVFNLIFAPGFSTAAKVTDISGRGVGMDVVKKNIEKIKGRVDVVSKKGEGTTLILRIPLTLAIMEGMLVRVGQSRYTIPILSIRESIQVTSERITTTMDGQEMVRVREEILPVLRLHELHNIEADHTELEKGLLVILEGQGEAFCLLVDEILGEQQTVIKGLSGYMGDVRGVSGCTILGDGEISLILDVGGLVNLALANFGDDVDY